MARKKTLYVSSTFEDLKAHRATLKTELECAGYDVESMERYAAFPQAPLDRCRADVAACDGYVLLLAHRYGYVPTDGNPDARSITELEYEHAVACGKPPFVFCVDMNHEWEREHKDRGDARDRLDAFRERVERAHGRGLFTTPDNLTKQVLSALSSYTWPAAEGGSGAAAGSAKGYRWPTAWDFSAYMADKREDFEGRAWLFEEVTAWLAAAHPRALLIRADFGVGKSAVMAELVHRNAGDTVVGWHFCQHDTQETLQPGAFVRSLAAQFAESIVGYRSLIEADRDLQALLDRALTDPGSALEGAILAPLSRLPAPISPATPRVLILDALDEALELEQHTAGPNAARGAITLVSLLAGKAARFPPWLRVLATSRPNPRVQAPLQHAFGLKEIDAESAGNQDDLRRFILGRCTREPLAGVLRTEGCAAQALADELVQRSLGKFLYAVRAMRDLEQRRISVPELVVLTPGMDSFYLDAFARRFTRAGRDYEDVRRVLGALAAAREPVSLGLLAQVLQVDEAMIKAARQLLPDFLRQRAGKLIFDHFSMVEWLTRDNDEGFARAGDFVVDLVAAQSAWRQWALTQFESGEAHRSDYLLRHLATHLKDDAERRRVCGALLFEHFEWLQARLDQAGIEALIADVEALHGVPDQAMLLAVLRNSAPVLRQSPDMLAPHVLGRVGHGLGTDSTMRLLATSTRAWLASAEQVSRRALLLLPMSRSLRLSVDNQVILVGGNRPLVVLPDGRIASGSSDNTVRLWDPVRPQQPIVFEGHSNHINALAVLRDGRIASGSEDNTVRLWDPAQPQLPMVFEGHLGSVDALAVLPDGRIASGSYDNTVRLWDPAQPGQSLVFEGHSNHVNALAVLPDGRIASCSWDGTVRLWDPARLQQPIVFEGHSGVVTALAVLPDGRIASGSDDGTMRLWDPARPRQPVVFEDHDWSVDALAVLPDGRIASGSADLRLWDPSRPKEKPIVYDGKMPLAVLADGRIASGSSDNTVRLWDPARPGQPTILEGHSSSVNALAVLPDGRIASGSFDETVRLWSPDRSQQAIVFEGHATDVHALAALPDGRIASGSSDKTVRLWDPARPQQPIVFEGHSGGVSALAGLPDGRIASGAQDETVRVWDPARPRQALVLEGRSQDDLLQAVLLGVPPPLLGVKALAVLPDGRIASCSGEEAVRLWDPARPRQPIVLEGHSGRVNALAVLPDGRIASGSSDNTVRLWNPAKPQQPIVFEGHSASVYALAALPDGRIASGSIDNTVRLWDPAQPQQHVIFEGHSAGVYALAALPDGRTVSGSSDNTVRLWDPARPRQPMVFKGHSGSINALVVLPDGRIASGSSDDTVLLWDPASRLPTRIFIADAPINCLTLTASVLIVAGCADGAVHFLREA